MVIREREEPTCSSCGGTPTRREGAMLYPCNECGAPTCSTCLDRSGTCASCVQDVAELAGDEDGGL
jgi:ribosomal protein L37AE/L43A